MIPPRNTWYRQALGRPHEAYARVEVWRSGVLKAELTYAKNSAPYTSNPLGFYSGSVRASLASKVTRTLDLTVPEWLYPWKTTDLLNPYGTELRAFRGIRYGNSSPDEFPVFVGTIEEISPPRGSVSIKASDTALRVAAAGFDSPMPSQSGSPIVDEFERIVLDANPLAKFGAHSPITGLVPVLSYDGDRGQALDNLAAAASANWYTLADGRYVLRYVPWTVPLVGAALPMSDGPGGTLMDAYPTRSASGIYNKVTVMSDRADGGPALYAAVADLDPASPTYIRGPFGVRSKSVRVTGAENQGQLEALGRAELSRSRALTESWQLTCVPDASIELGDPLALSFRSRLATQFVVSLSMPLQPDGTMAVQCRDLTGAES